MSDQPNHRVTNHDAAGRLAWSGAFQVAVGIFLGLGALRFVWVFGKALAVLVLGITIAEALTPVVGWVQRYMSRTAAVVAIYLVLICMALVTVWFFAPAIAHQAQQFLTIIPQQIGRLSDNFNQWFSKLGGSGGLNISDLLGIVSSQLVSLPMGIFTAGLTMVLVVFLSLYWLLARPSIGRFVRSFFPDENRTRLDQVMSDMGHAMGGYLRGVALNGLAVGFLIWIALYFANVHLPFVLGVIAALGEFFPYVGPILSAVPAVLVALVQSPSKAILTIIIYLAVDQIEGHVLTPNIMRSQTDIPRPLVIIALFGGGVVGGLLGAMVAIPMAGAAKVCVDELLAPALRRRLSARNREHPDR